MVRGGRSTAAERRKGCKLCTLLPHAVGGYTLMGLCDTQGRQSLVSRTPRVFRELSL